MVRPQSKTEQLARCAGVAPAQAAAALEQTGEDLLEAALLLELRGQCAPLAGGFYSTRPGAGGRAAARAAGQGDAGGEEPWKVRGRELLAALTDLLRHCTVNQLEIWRRGRQLSAVPVIILILLLVAAFWVTVPLLLFGALAGCRYQFTGPELDARRVNDTLDEAARLLREGLASLRREFSGRHKGGGDRGKEGGARG